MAITSSGVILATLAAANGKPVHLDDLYAAVQAAGINKERAKVYGDAQVMAAKRQILRGEAKQTFHGLDAGGATVQPEARELPVAEAPAPVKRTAKPTEPKPTAQGPVKEAVAKRKVKAAACPDADVLAYLTENLGPAVPRPMRELAYAYQLVGDTSGAELIEQARRTLGLINLKWSHWEQGPSVIVGFILP